MTKADSPDPESRSKISNNEWLSFRLAGVGARLIAVGSRLRESKDTYSASVAIREAGSYMRELQAVIELMDSGDFVEARIRLERLPFPHTIRKP